MGTEQFCLRWNDYHANITSAFSNIRDDDDFLDVTLVCDGNTVQAHKLVLSACSPLFRVMLKKNSHPQPMIFLRGIRYPDMVAILNFMYRGEVNVNQEDLQMFLAAAEELRIKGLSQASNDSKMEKLENVPKKKQVSGGALPGSLPAQPPVGQPPNKKLRESSPGISPVSTPASAKSPLGPEDDETEPPQLSVKREFKSREQGRQENNGDETDEDSQQNNLLDCLVQAQQNFAFQQGAGQGASPGFEQNNLNNYNSPQHIMSGGGSANPMSSSQGDKDFLGRGSPNPMKFGPTGGLPYEMHRLGGRNEDGLAHVVVMKTFRGWHCPHCSYISPSQKGNLKVHILNRHANPGESFGCMFCGKHLSSRSSLQVHISQVHREQQKAKRMLEERLKITNLEERLKSEMAGAGGVISEQMGVTAEALRLAMQQEERMKLEMNKHGMDMGSFLRQNLMENKAIPALMNHSGFDSGPASSSGSLPQSPKALTYGGQTSPDYSPGGRGAEAGPPRGEQEQVAGQEQQQEARPGQEQQVARAGSEYSRPHEQMGVRMGHDQIPARAIQEQPGNRSVPEHHGVRTAPEHHAVRAVQEQHGGRAGQEHHGVRTGQEQHGMRASQVHAAFEQLGGRAGQEIIDESPTPEQSEEIEEMDDQDHLDGRDIQEQPRQHEQHHHNNQEIDTEAVYHKEMGGDAVSVYPKEMNEQPPLIYRKEVGGHSVSIYPKEMQGMMQQMQQGAESGYGMSGQGPHHPLTSD